MPPEQHVGSHILIPSLGSTRFTKSLIPRISLYRNTSITVYSILDLNREVIRINVMSHNSSETIVDPLDEKDTPLLIEFTKMEKGLTPVSARVV